jgi:hypothetical protein
MIILAFINHSFRGSDFNFEAAAMGRFRREARFTALARPVLARSRLRLSARFESTGFASCSKHD